MSDPRLAEARLYGILDLGYVTTDRAADMTRAMLDGGVQILQLRAKQFSAADIGKLARALYPLTQAAGVPFIVNDHPDFSAPPFADGVHVGQDDGPVDVIRGGLATGALLGRSTHSVQQAVEAAAQPVDYLGFGPLFATPTKPDYTPIGIREIREVHEKVSCPVFCIGGVKLENLREVIDAGARRVVIVSGILHASDPAAYCRSVRGMLDAAS